MRPVNNQKRGLRGRLMDELEYQLGAVGREAKVVRCESEGGEQQYLPAIHVHIHEPSQSFPYYTFVTEGVAARAAPVPDEVVADWGEEARTDCAHIELVLYAAKESIQTQLDAGVALHDVWEAESLANLGHALHMHNVWAWRGHTLPLGHDRFPSALVTPLAACGDRPRNEREFGTIESDGASPKITLFALVPLTHAEMAVKRECGAESLYPFVGDAATDAGKPISFYADFNRQCATAQ
eukprot:m.168685 g.168685  ORF g.168685 m.168685 type:complete len:239 (-) comp12988_c0_seq1:125-841(-)